MSSKIDFNTLPEELVVEILSLLPLYDLNNISLSSRSLCRLAKDQGIWKGLFIETKSSSPAGSSNSLETIVSPSPRLWSSTVIHKGKMIMYGGHVCSEGSNVITEVRRDLFEYDFITKRWKELEHSLPALTEHKCVSHGDYLYFFGGYNGQTYCNSVNRYNPETGESLCLETTGEAFSPRSALTIVNYNNRIYTFGGWNGFDKKWFNDIHEFDFETNHWKQIEIKGTVIPPKRTSHASVIYKDSMYVIAGYSGEYYLNDLFQFNFETHKWTDLSSLTHGTKPQPRSRFCAIVHNDNMYLVGGWNKISYYSDMFSFNFETRLWTKIENSRIQIPSISQYSCVIYEYNNSNNNNNSSSTNSNTNNSDTLSNNSNSNNSNGLPVMVLFGGFCAVEKSMINRLYQYRLPSYDSNNSNTNINSNGKEEEDSNNNSSSDEDVERPNKRTRPNEYQQ